MKLKDKVICHVTSVHHWDDIRIFKKECVSLVPHVKKVYMIAPFAAKGVHHGVHVVDVPSFNKTGRIKRILKEKTKVLKAALKLDADIYHLHDPELLSFVKPLKKAGKRVIFDAHENTAAQILSKHWIKPTFLRKFISNRYEKYELNKSLRLDGVVSVLPKLTERFSHTNKETIYNYPIIDTDERLVPRSIKKGEKVQLVYNGGLTRIRGIKELISAMNYLNGERFELKLMGKWESESFKEECMGIIQEESSVKDLGLLEYDACQNVLKDANIGMCVFLKVENHIYSLPNKAFEYVNNYLPMIISDIPYWKEVFTEGANYVDPTNAKDIAKAVEYVTENYDEVYQKMLVLRKEVVASKSWQSQVPKLLRLYENALI